MSHVILPTRRAFLLGASACLATPALAQARPWAARAEGLSQLHALVLRQGGQEIFAEAYRGPGLDRITNVKSVSKTLVALLTDHPLATAETAANAADASDSAPKTKYGCGRVGLGSELLFDKTVDVERAVKYNIHCGTAAFKLSEVITNDDGDVDVVPRLITLNRIKAKLQEPNGRALRKAPYTHDAIHVKIDPTVHAPTQFSLTLRDQHFTIECPTHAEALIAALSIRRFKEKFMVVTRLET